MVHDTVEMVSVEWLMQNIHSSVDNCNNSQGRIDFHSLMRRKAFDYQMSDLLGTIIHHGFRVPICLYPDRLGSTKWSLGNGHHRMAAAILLCLDEIPVYWSSGEFMSCHATDTECLDSFDEYSVIEDLCDYSDFPSV